MKKILFLSSLGGILEFYDFIIFVFFANIITKVFYPSDMDKFWANLDVYATFAIGYFARPLGGIIMAHFGDKKGRKKIFLLSILLMVIPTFLLGVLPKFEQIGYFAPIALIVIRILQGVAVGGELPGAWVYVSEHSKKGYLGRMIGILTASVVGGIFFGGGITLLLYYYFDERTIEEWAFRIPFLIGGGFGIFSIYLRSLLEESPEFLKIQKNNHPNLPIKEVFRHCKVNIILGMLLTWMLTGCVIIIVLLIPNYMTGVLGFDNFQRLSVQLFSVGLSVLGCVIAGVMVDKLGMIQTAIIFGILMISFNGLFFMEFSKEKHHILKILTYYLCSSFANGVIIFVPLFMVMLYPVSYRFSALSFAYNIAYAVFGGFTPILVVLFMESFIMGIGYYMIFLGSIFLCISFYLSKILYKN